MKKIKIGINGFGRIGRQLTKLIINSDTVELSAINDLADSKTSAHLFKYDTSYGIFNGDIECNDSEIIINGSKIKNSLSEILLKLTGQTKKLILSLKVPGFLLKRIRPKNIFLAL